MMLERGGRVGLDFLIKLKLSKKEVSERYFIIFPFLECNVKELRIRDLDKLNLVIVVWF